MRTSRCVLNIERIAVGAALALLLSLCNLCVAQDATPAAPQGGVIAGLVKSGNMPLPGVSITASNTLTGQKVTTWTDVTGNYSMQVPSNGRYVVRTQMAAFAPMTGEVLINAANPLGKLNLELTLQSRVQRTSRNRNNSKLPRPLARVASRICRSCRARAAKARLAMAETRVGDPWEARKFRLQPNRFRSRAT